MKTLAAIASILIFSGCSDSDENHEPIDTLKTGTWVVDSSVLNDEDQTILWAGALFDFKGNGDVVVTTDDTEYTADWSYRRVSGSDPLVGQLFMKIETTEPELEVFDREWNMTLITTDEVGGDDGVHFIRWRKLE